MVIPVFNNWRLTAGCIASIFQSDFPKELYEIIVVDNASTDTTKIFLDYLIEQGEPIKVVKNKENLGFVLGTNQGWKEVKTPYIMLLSNDVTLEKKCVKLMIETFEKRPKIGIVGAVQYLPNGFCEPPLRWFTWQDEKNIFKKTDLEKEDWEMDYIINDIVGFACAMVKQEVWKKIGFLDEQFSPAMWEQEDYCLRSEEAGYLTALVPKAKFVHRVAATTNLNFSYFQSIIEINRKKFVEKWRRKFK